MSSGTAVWIPLFLDRPLGRDAEGIKAGFYIRLETGVEDPSRRKGKTAEMGLGRDEGHVYGCRRVAEEGAPVIM